VGGAFSLRRSSEAGRCVFCWMISDVVAVIVSTRVGDWFCNRGWAAMIDWLADLRCGGKVRVVVVRLCG